MDFKKKSKYSRNKPNVGSKYKSGRNRNGGYGGYGNNGIMDDYKQSTSHKNSLDKISNHAIAATGTSTSFYGIQTLQNAKRIFGDEKFNLYQHIKELFGQTSTGDVPDLLRYLQVSKSQTSDFLSKKVKNQYKEFISMSRNVLEIEDQMSEMDDMLKSMSISMKSLHETNFKMLQKEKGHPYHHNNDNSNILNDIGINEEEQIDRERQEMEVLQSMHEQILQHIQLRQLQQATDLIVTAKNEHVNLKQSARKRAMNFINNHIHELESLIVDQLSSTSYLPEIKRDKLSTLLMKLGFVDETMELYLSHKSKSLKQTIRAISLYGDVKQYIQDLSKVFFDEIITCTIKYTHLLNKIEIQSTVQRPSANAANLSLNPFDMADEKESDVKEKPVQQHSILLNSVHMSRLIVWIYKELSTYEKLFEQQVFQLEQNDFRTIGECLKIVFKQSTRLDQSGIHVSFLLSNHFKPSIEAAINRLYKKKLESIKKLIVKKENYESTSKKVSNANTNKNIIHIHTRKNKRMKQTHTATKNPFTSTDTRRRSAVRHSRYGALKDQAQNANAPGHVRRSSEIFGQVDDENNDEKAPETDANMTELRKLTYRRLSKGKSNGNGQAEEANKNKLGGVAEEKSKTSQFSMVKLTRSGQEMYEIVKKCIQETWRLLDQRYYSELTKSVYRTVVTQMIYLVQVYSSQITQEINEKAPKQLTAYRRSLLFGQNKKMSAKRKSRRNSSKIKNLHGINTIMENEQFGDDEKSENVLTEQQMLSLMANVYYVSEDLLTRIAYRYQKLFGRQIPELQLFAIEQQKLYNAQFQQFGKKFLYKWVCHKLLWKNECICASYAAKSDVSIVTKEEIASWSVSAQFLSFVRYFCNLRLEIDKYLGSNKDIIILRDSIELLLKELYHGNYIPDVSEIEQAENEEILISVYGLNKLYLDFRFFIITLANFLTPNSKNLCNSICEKAKKYVNYKYNLKINVDWKLMHSLAMRLQYKALSGDELDALNKSYLSSTSSASSGSSSPHNKDIKKRSSNSSKNSGKNPFM